MSHKEVGGLRLHRWWVGLALAVVTVLGGAVLTATTAAAATNLIANGDFETGTTGGWTCSRCRWSRRMSSR